MQIKNLLLGSALLSSTLFAGGDITPVEPVVEEITAETNTWSFELEPYLMLTDIEGDSKFGNVPTTELDVDFGTILDNLFYAYQSTTYVKAKSGKPDPTLDHTHLLYG